MPFSRNHNPLTLRPLDHKVGIGTRPDTKKTSRVEKNIQSKTLDRSIIGSANYQRRVIEQENIP